MSDEMQKHTEYMSQAVQLAKKGLYTTHPNPRVGCVIVKDDRIIGEGFHARAGEGHAEVNALASAMESVEGATAYVTLEPCSHQGKTPPCADALIKAGIAVVVYGMQDPNPQVAGRGLAKLEKAGVQVIGPVLENECERLNLGFNKRMREGLPYIRLKMAMSLDGRTAMESGESQWITGSAARLDVQRLRAQSDAIVTGIGSVILDNPSMTVRIDSDDQEVDSKSVRQPLRVIMDTALSIPPEAKILKPGKEALMFCVEEDIEQEHFDALKKTGVNIEFAPVGEDGRMDLIECMGLLADQGINEVLVETGAELAGAFLREGLVDELVVYVAPKLLGSDARPLMRLPIDVMKDAVELELESVRSVGNDLKMVYFPKYLEEDALEE
ncbi:bifunctional diaminohydroxyphosphoribosylaminopyrimidine deaminase/5-amino-6-(5-phosphoribosylamino)uracil reductase RibD [Marinomonas mediterranea]|jgi:diaminohydroxyphosphoribosylaminopyrimidine deaminase (EC 3.5.4.26)/5-amino-6-(5-phosphoribosylamino)uracil reductase (EC 1.1.1.193)|uniref:Riboflavin biosynthesis protein RibD n=1 Tax=Marinomonas mediterranea (strain ATCC 700492 / JCM 21426 / NBRC 103028 / MMB-1) TaxID=717774 RepID=F2JZL1_MARM1|nr:bifunctional diaminohydroxyphosphoribosylaminopyrimidine deaminase/5-amino-6-(5-phosphoribosylamino)uracil reductase RibD [Marinomonas mediterranea]ADZ89794.1 riboflavin biosynthesis protein RibD [Marinomonas mediterranea MMB-1]